MITHNPCCVLKELFIRSDLFCFVLIRQGVLCSPGWPQAYLPTSYASRALDLFINECSVLCTLINRWAPKLLIQNNNKSGESSRRLTEKLDLTPFVSQFSACGRTHKRRPKWCIGFVLTWQAEILGGLLHQPLEPHRDIERPALIHSQHFDPVPTQCPWLFGMWQGRKETDRLSVFLQFSLKEEDSRDYPKDVPSLTLAAVPTCHHVV